MEDKVNGLQVIKENTEFLVSLPWNGHYGMFKIRMLNSTQIKACGNFSTLEVAMNESEDDKEIDDGAVIELKNMQERIMKFALVSPTYDEILEELEASELIESVKKQIDNLRLRLKEEKDSLEKHEIAKDIDAIELYLGFLFPEDFAAMLIAVIIQRDNTDIRKVTKSMLLEAAVLAERGHDNPSDHVDGIFTEFQKEDINKYAWIVLSEHREQEKMVKETGSRKWIRGSKKRS